MVDDKNASTINPLLQPVILVGHGGHIVDEEGTDSERPKEPWKKEYAKSIVYAGLDAIVTSFSLISSISGGHLSSVDVLVLGFSNLVADGISMGFGDFISTSTERDMAANERSVTEWEVANHGRPQEQELLQKYQDLGMTPGDATTVVSVLAKYRDVMVHEKQMLPPDQTEKPWKSGLVTFAAFIVFGCAPLLAFIILIPFTKNDAHKFVGACVFSAFALILLGLAKAKIVGQNYVASVAITLSNGAVAGAAAYGIGWTLRNVAGLED
ncbi:unnamed protein product [Coffea canephora]|uniref:Vacuolar iron transporter n=1 Tax=Coffea canephora TaxID=49390 RepID=A0A068UK94_COFCA|nr:unnamed protein product [Coffea canephora]